MKDKINDELEQAFRQGYEEGMRAEATKELIETASGLFEAITEVVTSTLSRVDISAMYDAKEAAKAYEELEEKHLSECRQISEYEQENRKLRELLEDVQPVIHAYWIELPKALNPAENPCQCSNCKHILSFMNHYPKSKYCDNCGARMDKESRRMR